MARADGLLTSGEFARLCGVEKSTLLFYDRIGIFSPRHQGENGYRYYDGEQFRQFNIILMMRRSGASLAEIGAYLTAQGEGAYLAMLERRADQIAEEMEELQRMGDKVANTLRKTRLCRQHLLGVPFAEQREERYYATTFLPPAVRTARSRLGQATAHLVYRSDQGLEYDFLKGAFIPLENAALGVAGRSHFCHRITAPQGDPDRLFLRPAGLCVAVMYEGAYADMTPAILGLLAAARAWGRPVGPILEYEVLGMEAGRTPDRYLVELSVMVEPDGDSGQ